MKILLVFWEVTGVEYHRLTVPFEHLAQDEGLDVTRAKSLELKDPSEWSKLKDFDVCIFNRNISPVMMPHTVFENLRKLNIKIVCDLDDYWALPKHHVLAKNYRMSGMDLCIKDQVQYADEVWVTQTHLRDMVRPINKNVHVIPNAISPTKMDKIGNEYTEKTFWAGSITHREDLKMIKDLPIDVVGVGKLPTGEIHPEWVKIMNMMPNATFHEAEYMVDRYHNIYKDKGISLAPLIDNKFNRCKSNLKMLEAGWYEKPIIASDTFPYKQTGTHLKDVLFVRRGESWEKAVKRLEGSRDLQDTLRGNLYDLVTSRFMIHRINERRMDRLWKLSKKSRKKSGSV